MVYNRSIQKVVLSLVVKMSLDPERHATLLRITTKCLHEKKFSLHAPRNAPSKTETEHQAP